MMNMENPSPNDDEDFEPEELNEAADETPTDTTAPEVDTRTKTLTEWDEAPSSHGSAVPKTEVDDEDTISQRLVYEGTDEAERERRIAAADPDFEP